MQPARILSATLLLLCASSASLPAANVQQTYTQFCAACHGPAMGGGLGPSLVDDTWIHGADDANIARIIREGYPANGMPPYGQMLSDPDIRALVVYIREQSSRVQQAAQINAAPDPGAVVKSEVEAYRVEQLTDALEIPWSIDFLPDGRVLVTEKAGRLRIIENDRLLPDPVEGIPAVATTGQGGLLSVGVHPDYKTNGWIYLSFSDPGPDGSALTAVIRGRLKDNKFVDQETIFRAPYTLYKNGGVHFGSRFVFHDGYLFFGIGERGAMQDAQDLKRPNGKIHRLHDDGRIPEDNPFVKTPGALPSIWTYGNRNPQGLTWRSAGGQLWETEHGPRGGDELNLLQPGRNYGWPVITYGMNYNGTPITGETSRDGMEQPVIHWTPSIAVCAAKFYEADRFKNWKGNLLVTSLARQELRRLVLDGDKVVHQEILFSNIGRVRDVAPAPDGSIYVSLEKPGRILRLTPAE